MEENNNGKSKKKNTKGLFTIKCFLLYEYLNLEITIKNNESPNDNRPFLDDVKKIKTPKQTHKIKINSFAIFVLNMKKAYIKIISTIIKIIAVKLGFEKLKSRSFHSEYPAQWRPLPDKNPNKNAVAIRIEKEITI